MTSTDGEDRLGDSFVEAISGWMVVDATPDAIIVVDEQGAIVHVNRQAETMFGYRRHEIVGDGVEKLLPERLAAIHTAHRTRYRVAPSVRPMGAGAELLARCRDGRELPVEVSLSPLHADGCTHIVAAVRDVTARVDADAREREIRSGLDLIEDGVFMFDAESLQFGYVNAGAVDQVGYTRDELLTMTPLHVKPEFTEVEFRRMLAPLLAGEITSLHFTTVHRRKDGTDLPVEIVLQDPPPPGTGRARRCIALVRDISDRLRREAEAAEVDRVTSLLEDRDRIARDLHDRVIGQLFGVGLSLQGTAPMIDDPAVIARLNSAVQQLDDAIADVRASIFDMRPQRAAEKGVREEILDTVADHHQQLGFEPRVSFDGPVDALTESIGDQLVAVVGESLTNVLKHASASEVSIDIQADPGSVSLTVADDGAGFDTSMPRGRDHERLDHGGLANITARARALGGNATVSSTPGIGTTIEWTAPLPETGAIGE